jgi:hypothetical protein
MSSPSYNQLGLSDPGVTPHIKDEDLVLYALQFLPGEVATEIVSHVEQCERCRNELALTQGDLASCAFTSEPQTPPSSARQRLRTQVTRENHPVLMAPPTLAAFGRNRSVMTSPDNQPAKRSLALTLLGWLGWIVAAGLAAVAATLYRQEIAQRDQQNAQASQIARLNSDSAHAAALLEALKDPNAARILLTSKPPAKPEPQGRITYNSANGNLILLVDDLDPLEAGKVYELWLLPADGRNPIASALFHPDDHGNASVILPTLPTGVAAKGFGVSIEDEGGAQAPTLPFVLASS